MSTLDALKEIADEEKSMESLISYREAIMYEIEVGRKHIGKLNTVSDDNPRKKESLETCEKTISHLKDKLKAVNSKISLNIFDLHIEKKEEKVKVRNKYFFIIGISVVVFSIFSLLR